MNTHRKRTRAAKPASLSNIERSLGPIVHLPISQLKAYAGNPRRHPEKQFVKIMASIAEFGFTIPVLVDPDHVIIAGEARVEAARRLGFTSLPVLVAADWSPAQVRAYRLVDNRLTEHGEWDRSMLAVEFAAIIEIGEMPIDILGWEIGEIDVILEEQEESPSEDPADAIEAPPALPVTRPGDIWLLGKHRLICGSSLDGAVWQALMNGQTAAMAFTDPPYNVPVNGHVSGLGKVKHAEFTMASGEMSPAEFTAFLTDFLRELANHAADGAIIDVCMDWRHLKELLIAIEAAGLSLLNLCVWCKTNGGMGSLYRSQHELILIAKKGKAPHKNNVQLGAHGRYRTNTWNYAGVNSFSKSRMADLGDHPTVKPVALVADAIRDVTDPGDIVTDAFMGSGTTMLAAERTGRVAYGVEIAPGYVDVAIRRWETMTGREATLASTGATFSETTRARVQDELPEEAAE
ncbi:site-specific DNA-methyltransferase [Sphingobium bisphenolivorans]|uniref:site-specific DNA-methyltransferase n=1 Tax=Sphingobium bisphenolivorans TaxID=1335760 RepID=UPI0003A44891|nr:DNA methyltransferase [Sphingobium bisphenolivorans]